MKKLSLKRIGRINHLTISIYKTTSSSISIVMLLLIRGNMTNIRWSALIAGSYDKHNSLVR